MLHALSGRLILAGSLLAVEPLGEGSASVLAAQATTGALHGVVSGSDGTTPRGAVVEARSVEMSATRSARTDGAGAYHLLGLAPGVYRITARALGYRQQRHESVRLVVGQRARVDFILDPGAVELEPMVVTAGRTFEVQRSDVSTAVLQEEIQKLPLNTRNLLNLAAIAPGIRTFAPEGGRSVPAAGALPVTEPRFSNFYVDGLEWKGMYTGQVVAVPGAGTMIPQEAVREFRVYLSPYDAEHTRGASHIISAVTHRGGNTMEGSLFGFFQDKSLVAKGGYPGKEPAYSRYQSGGNLRGPLVRNRLFFSASYEAQITDNFIEVVPGQPTENPDIWRQYARSFKAPQRLHVSLLRLTAPAGRHTLDATWATRHINSEFGFGVRLATFMLAHEAGLSSGSRVNSFHIRDTYASTSLVNELTVHVLDSRLATSSLAPGPTFQYPGIQTGRNNYPLALGDRHLSAVNRTTYTVSGPTGQHVLKAGLELTHVRTSAYRPNFAEGSFRFITDTSTLPSEGRIAVGLADPTSTREAQTTIRGWLVGGHLQDEWQPIPSLTITAGVRYDAEVNTLNQKLATPWAGDTTLQRALGERFLNTGDRKADLDNLAPRVAVAWDLSGSGRTFVRGGYGVIYDRVPLFGALNEAISVGWRTYLVQNPGTTDPAELRRQVAGRSAPAPNLVLLKDRLETPANHQWSLGIGHQLRSHLALNLDYVNQRVTNTYVSVSTNLPVGGRRPIPSYGTIVLWDDFGDAEFDALLASVTYDRKPARLNVAYTLGRARSEFGEFTVSDYGDSAAYNMQRSEGDERHRLVVSGLTTLPLGLDFSGIAIVASPRPFLVTTGTDANGNGTMVDDWPNGVRTSRRSGWSHWYRTVDLRLGKSFPAPRGTFQVTLEAFNLFNWANHSEYQGTQQSLLDYGEPIGDYARRQAQLGLRYQF